MLPSPCATAAVGAGAVPAPGAVLRPHLSGAGGSRGVPAITPVPWALPALPSVRGGGQVRRCCPPSCSFE